MFKLGELANYNSNRWEEIKVEGWAGHRLVAKLKVLKTKIEEWVRVSVGDVQIQKFNILAKI